MGVDVAGENLGVVFGDRPGVRSVEEGARKSPPNREDKGVIAGDTVVLRIEHLSEAGVEPGGCGAVMNDQIAWKFIDVLSIANVIDLTATREQVPAGCSRIDDRRYQIRKQLA